ncbi:protease II family protein [Nitzschia inconspicua]|uniref:Prolyl endopeptidase-like n=1 Tax=Nitzschia inconspicua TaxID=303405 RepID=A0A9K3PQ59_9STRA|nr:protease II family protein [Nitzschia inconspicua]
MWGRIYRNRLSVTLSILFFWIHTTRSLVVRFLRSSPVRRSTVQIRRQPHHRPTNDNGLRRTSIGPRGAYSTRWASRNSNLNGKNAENRPANRASTGSDEPIPPKPRREDDRMVFFGNHQNMSVGDPYGWMRDDSRVNSEVRLHIEAENTYTKQVTRQLRDLERTLETEYQSATSSSHPDISNVFRSGDYIYYTKRISAKPYAVHCRKHYHVYQDSVITSKEVPEEIILDENELASNVAIQDDIDYLAVHIVLPSPSHRKIAYSMDTKGDERYCIIVQDLESGSATTIATNASGNFVWGQTDQSIHYVCYDSDARLRPCRWMEWSYCVATSEQIVHCHREETDDRSWCHLGKSSDGKFILWKCNANSTRMIWSMALLNDSIHRIHRPTGKEDAGDSYWYDVDHGTHGWWMISCQNHHHALHLLFDGSSSQWGEVLWLDILGDGSSSTLMLESLYLFTEHLVLFGRNEGLTKAWILNLSNIKIGSNDATVIAAETLKFDETAHYLSAALHQDFFSCRLVLSYESMLQPPEILDICLTNPSDRRILYRKVVPGYDSNLYACDRRLVMSRDGVAEIPISMVYLKSCKERQSSSLHLLGYGAYGHSLEPSFSLVRLPLLNRWNHMCHCTQNGFTSPEKIGIEGRSAGGLLVAGALNQNPGLFKTALLVEPFLDPLLTMADSSLPLTALEYGEWGDPHCEEDFKIMKTWSPIQNIGNTTTYPSVFVVGGLQDSRVRYWELLKYAAALRHAAKDESLSRHCVWIDTSAGHASGGNQETYWKRLSTMYAFFLSEVAATERII